MAYRNETQARRGYVDRALDYVGTREGSKGHEDIRQAYGQIKPRPRAYMPTLKDDWCAEFVCAMGWLEGHREWPWEVSVLKIVQEAQRRGIWVDGHREPPGVGAWIVYDWDHNGSGNHIGLIAGISGGNVYTVEGNYGNAVKERIVRVGDEDILGYVDLDFSGVVDVSRPLRPGDEGEDVYTLQVILRGAGCFYGAPTGGYDEKTTAAVMDFQRVNGLEVDGKAGPKTQAVIRSGKFEIFTEEDDTMEQQKRYQTVEELPEWAKATISKMVKLGYLKGDGQGLDLSLDMIRVFVANDRAGLYDGKIAQLS